jgi:hypothetical protein
MTLAATRPPLAVPHPVVLGPCRCQACREQLVWCGHHWHAATTFGNIATPWPHECPKAAG